MSKNCAIGIDIGGTKTMFALINDKFRVVDEIKVKTQAENGEKHFTRNMAEATNALMAKAQKNKLPIVGIGIGCAGAIDSKQGVVDSCLNIPFLNGYPLGRRVAKLTDMDVYVANDVQAGLYGEQQVGAAVGCNNVIGVFIGTGIGGAVIIDGKLHLGATGHAGNIGHYLLHPMGSLAGYDREGTLDSMASRTAIAGEAATLASKQWAPHLLRDVGTDVARIKASDLAKAILKGDKTVEQLVRSRSRIVGIALSNLVDFLNPEMIVLGGGLVDAMPSLIAKEVRAGIDENATPESRRALRVVTSKLKEHSVTVGAAKLALDSFTKR